MTFRPSLALVVALTLAGSVAGVQAQQAPAAATDAATGQPARKASVLPLAATSVTHTFPGTSPHWYDVKLAVSDGNHMSFYRQALAVEFQPTLFPATPNPSEPAPPATNPCGTLSAQEQAAITPPARTMMARLNGGTATVSGAKS